MVPRSAEVEPWIPNPQGPSAVLRPVVSRRQPRIGKAVQAAQAPGTAGSGRQIPGSLPIRKRTRPGVMVHSGDSNTGGWGRRTAENLRLAFAK